MIVVNLCGGLGNQMFQYALGRRLALAHDAALKLDVRPFAGDPLREYRLDHFLIKGTVAGPRDLALALPWPRAWPPRFAWLPRLPGRLTHVKEQGFPFDPTILRHTDSVYLEGYWQSERYFADRAGDIRADFRLREPMAPARLALARRMQETSAVSVHVRRGDYVSNPVTNAYHGTCSPEWYERAMTAMADAVGTPTFFVFSDDPAWARANLPDKWPAVYVDPQPDGRDFEDLHLMARCHHHIIANSSFSWWGAWLDPRPDKRVIAPARWFNQATSDTRDLIPAGWQRL